MIKATFLYETQERIGSFRISGHAGYADRGQDIICAGVSGVALAIINSLDLHYPSELESIQQEGLIECKIDYDRLNTFDQEIVARLMEVVRLACEGIRDAYGEEYIELLLIGGNSDD